MRKSASAKSRLARLLRHDADFVSRGFRSLAGVDEAGRGPLAGPVVASAVIVRDFSFESNINDSKKLAPETREIAYREIMQKCSVAVSVIDHHVIDSVNIFQAAMLAMEDAVKRLSEPPDCVLVDGNRAPKGLTMRRVPIIGGDAASLSIACASIVAKVTRDRIMEEYDKTYPQYGFKSHKGYCTPEHLQALKKHGLTPIHRRSFEPVKTLAAGGKVDLDRYLRAELPPAGEPVSPSE